MLAPGSSCFLFVSGCGVGDYSMLGDDLEAIFWFLHGGSMDVVISGARYVRFVFLPLLVIGVEVLVPFGGFKLLAVDVAADGGSGFWVGIFGGFEGGQSSSVCLLRALMLKLPAVVQRFRCALSVVFRRWFMRLYKGSASSSMLGVQLASRAGGLVVDGGPRRVRSSLSFVVWPLRLSCHNSRMHPIDWTLFSSAHNDPMASDVISPSPWTIFGCKNGLRLFMEANDGGSRGKYWDDHPAIMAVGVVDANSEPVFQTLMSLGQSRFEWDFCLGEGKVVEHLDGHTDIIHKKLRGDWLPWGMRKRDLLLRRYWRREDDGTYVILYHSVFHYKCHPERGCIRACLKSGGYVISPVNQGRQSVVKHMLAIDWKFWKSYIFTSSAKYITIRMLGRIAALREFLRAKNGNCACMEFSSGELTRDMRLSQGENECINLEMYPANENRRLEGPTEGSHGGSNRQLSSSGSFVQLNDAADEFFDVPGETEYDQRDMFPSDESTNAVDQWHGKLSTAAVFVKRLHDLAVQKRGYVDLQGASDADIGSCCYGYTLPKDLSCTVPSTWAMTDPTTFLIRGEAYLHDRLKIKANSTLMQMVGADWVKSDKREDDLGGRTGGLVQTCAAQGGSKFFFIVNIQVPGSTTYSLALYYMMDTPLEKVPLLERFVNGDDSFRNSRFKLIPYISKGSWIVKQSVGKKACLVGQALEINYFRGSNYFELGVDIGSSTVARGVVSLVLGYLNSLVIEMAFLVQGNTQEELPEFLLGTCRLNYLDATKAVSIDEC